jgi:CHAT domain-containing protein
MATRVLFACTALCAALALPSPALRAQPAPAAPVPEEVHELSETPEAFEARSARLRQALADAEQREGADSIGAAQAAVDLANAYYLRNRFAEALPLYRRALQIGEQRLPGNDPRLAAALLLTARSYSALGESPVALPLAQRGLAMLEALWGTDDGRLYGALQMTAQIGTEVGDRALSIKLARRALAIAEKSFGPESPLAGDAQNSLGMYYVGAGRYGEGLEPLQRAYAIAARNSGPDSFVATQPLFNLGTLYADLGRFDQALPIFERAVRNDERNIGSLNYRVANKLQFLANALRALKRCPEALPHAQRSVEIAEKLNTPNNLKLSSSYLSLANVYQCLKRDADAQPLIEKVLGIRERVQGPYHPQVAAMLVTLAHLKRRQGDVEGSRELLLRAMAIAARGDQAETMWQVQSSLRATAKAGGHTEEAIYWGKAAVNTIQSMRANLHELPPELQSSFVESRRAPYKQLAALLIDDGRLGEAEQVLALLKDQELSQLIRRGDAARPTADMVGAERGAADQFEKLIGGELEREHQLDALERRAAVEALSADDEARRRDLQEEATQWRANLKQWLAALPKQLASQPGTRAPSATNLVGASTALSTLVRSDPDAVGLYYVVTDDTLSVIIATPRGSFGRRIDVGAVELNRRIAKLRQALLDPRVDPRPAALAMYQTLLAPIADDLEKAQAHTLVLSLTDNLRYIPFAALYDGRQYLVERYAVAQVLAGATSRRETEREPWQISAFGMTQAAPPLQALTGVRAELESIVQVPGTRGGVLPGTIHLDGEFDRPHLEAALRGEHRVVHIGSHFVLRPGADEDGSFLLLGDRSHLGLDEIATLDFSGVDQLTLSACDTATGGGKDQDGIEVEGMAAAVAKQGAASVLASLWPVSDRSTASLMFAFYQGRASGDGLGRAVALQRAQLSLLRGAGTAPAAAPLAPPGSEASAAASADAAAAFQADPALPYAHPFFWAPFVIMGDWR